MNVNKTELRRELSRQVEALAEYAMEMILACGEHERSGSVSLKVRAKPKDGRLVVDAVCASNHPTGADTDERFKGIPSPIAAYDIDEEQGQEHIPGVES